MSHRGQDGNRNNMSNTKEINNYLEDMVLLVIIHQAPTLQRENQLADEEVDDGFPLHQN